jgi:hypothetical protein
VERWNGGTVERWNGGTVERRRPSRWSWFKSKALVVGSLFLWSLFLRVFARFARCHSPGVPTGFGANQLGTNQENNSRERAKTREWFLDVDPRPSASSALIRGSSYVFQAGSGRVSWEQF